MFLGVKKGVLLDGDKAYLLPYVMDHKAYQILRCSVNKLPVLQNTMVFEKCQVTIEIVLVLVLSVWQTIKHYVIHT